MLKKLRFKFVLINMVIVTSMLCVIFGLIYHFTETNLESDSLNMMQNLADRPFKLGAPGDKTEDVRLPYFTLQVLKTGELVSTGGGYYDLSDDDFLQELYAAATDAAARSGVLEEYNLRFLRCDGHGEPCIVFTDISNEQAVLEHLMRTFIFIGLTSFVALLGISLLLANWAVKPVDEAWKQQRQFIADASHELKTPLTVILTNAELLQSSEYDDESRGKFSDSIVTMAQQMRELVEQLLELARADNAQRITVFSQVELSKLCSDALLPFEPVFFEKGLTLESEIEAGIVVSGGEAQLRQVTDILLDNAQKYASPGGKVCVTLKRLSRSHCLLSVANTGEPIPHEELKNIFKRFYRVDKARSRGSGFGLGLSIADSIVTQHKGRIWAESKDGINSFKVELPTAQI